MNTEMLNQPVLNLWFVPGPPVVAPLIEGFPNHVLLFFFNYNIQEGADIKMSRVHLIIWPAQ